MTAGGAGDVKRLLSNIVVVGKLRKRMNRDIFFNVDISHIT